MAACPDEQQTVVGGRDAAVPGFGGHVRDQLLTRGAGEPGDTQAVVRLFEPSDEPAVLELLHAAFGTWPHELARSRAQAAEFFRWKHLEGPFGRSLMLVAELEGSVVGFHAYMPWLLSVDGQTVATMRAVDLAVDPRHRRHGISLALRTAVEFSPEVALMWGNPNPASITGSRALDHAEVSRLPSFVRPGPGLRHTLRRLASHERAPRPLGDILAPAAQAALGDEALLRRLRVRAELDERRLATLKHAAFLRWRYAPEGYHALRVEGRGGAGLAIFRRTTRGPFAVASVCELLLERRDPRVERRLLRDVARAADADFVACVLSARREGVARGLLGYRSREGLTMRVLKDDLAPDPRSRRSWSLSRGDLELI